MLSWVDFTDAVDIYLHNMDQVRRLHDQSRSSWDHPSVLSGLQCSHAYALMELTRNVFRESRGVKERSKLWSLEALVLKASAFGCSEIRDTLYALLYLANDATSSGDEVSERRPANIAFSSDYSRHPVELFSDFVQYSIDRSRSLDIICRPWATMGYVPFRDGTFPSWIGVGASRAESSLKRLQHSEVLLGLHEYPLYRASRGVSEDAILPAPVVSNALHSRGVIIGKINRPSTLLMGGKLQRHALQTLGWEGSLTENFDNSLWKTLVANRSPLGKTAPAWYRRACALALTKLDKGGNLDIPMLISSNAEPSAMVDYLRRVQDVVDGRATFRLGSDLNTAPTPRFYLRGIGTTIGLGPEDIKHDDLVCILFGCSVPVVVRPKPLALSDPLPKSCDPYRVTLIGPCYVHNYMEGELFAGLSQTEIDQMAQVFSII